MGLARKGDKLTFTVDTTGGHWLVLKTNGNYAYIMRTSSYMAEAYNPTGSAVYTAGNVYKDSLIENIMLGFYENNTFGIKDAVIPREIKQKSYTSYNSEPTSYNYRVEFNWSTNNEVRWLKYDSETEVGDRYFYPLSVTDIFNYYGKSSLTSKEIEKIYNPYSVDGDGYSSDGKNPRAWLLDALTTDSLKSWNLDGGNGTLNVYNSDYKDGIRPVCWVDLTKLTYTGGTGTDGENRHNVKFFTGTEFYTKDANNQTVYKIPYSPETVGNVYFIVKNKDLAGNVLTDAKDWTGIIVYDSPEGRLTMSTHAGSAELDVNGGELLTYLKTVTVTTEEVSGKPIIRFTRGDGTTITYDYTVIDDTAIVTTKTYSSDKINRLYEENLYGRAWYSLAGEIITTGDIITNFIAPIEETAEDLDGNEYKTGVLFIQQAVSLIYDEENSPEILEVK